MLPRPPGRVELGPRAQIAQRQAVYLTKALDRRLRRCRLPTPRLRPGALAAHLGYRLLYRAHLIAVLGVVRTGAQVLVGLLRRSTLPRIKMHGT